MHGQRPGFLIQRCIIEGKDFHGMRLTCARVHCIYCYCYCIAQMTQGVQISSWQTYVRELSIHAPENVTAPTSALLRSLESICGQQLGQCMLESLLLVNGLGHFQLILLQQFCCQRSGAIETF